MSTSSAGPERAGLRQALRQSPPLLWAGLYFFCLLSGYYVLRPVREAMAASADLQTVFPPALIAWFPFPDVLYLPCLPSCFSLPLPGQPCHLLPAPWPCQPSLPPQRQH